MHKSNIAKTTFSILALCACACSGAATDPAEADIDATDLSFEENTPADDEVVAELEVDGYQVAFLLSHAADGSERLALRESGLPRTEGTPLQLVLDQGLTALETYLALAPAGSTAPDALVRAHPTQAAALEREDTKSVREFTFTPVAHTEKSAASCDAWVLTTMGGNFSIINPVRRTRTASGQSTQEYTGWTVRNVTLGVCNDTQVQMGTRPFWVVQPSDPNMVNAINTNGIFVGNWSLGTFFNLPALTSVRWYNWAVHGPETCSGLVCTIAPTMYAVQGLGNPVYHFRTAELAPVIR